jgi:hypothetical protein
LNEFIAGQAGLRNTYACRSRINVPAFDPLSLEGDDPADSRAMLCSEGRNEARPRFYVRLKMMDSSAFVTADSEVDEGLSEVGQVIDGALGMKWLCAGEPENVGKR